MVNDWIETTLGDISIDVSYGYTESANTEKVGPKFLRITDIQNGVVDWKSVPYCPIDNSKLDKYVLEKGDIVVARTGNSTGENYIFTGSEETVYASYLIRFRIDENIANPFYVWYSMRSPNWWAFVNSSKTGSAQAGANAKVLGLYPLDLPNLDTQKAIAHILGSLDNKIELNRQMNETLEAMAQALFKSWFVDFDPVIDNALAAGNAIPDEFAERAKQRKAIEKKDNADIQSLFPDEFEFTEEMGWIPKGWEISTLGQESDFSNGYAFKSKELTAESKDAFHVFKMGHIKRGGGFNYDGTKSYFPIEAAKDLERYLLKKGDLLMAMTDMKSSMALLGHTALMPEDDKFLVNQRVGRLSVKEDATLNYPYIYIYSNLDTTIGELRSRANSGVQVNLSTAEIKATNILVPSRSVHDIFDVKAISFFEKIFLNDRLNRKLAETRDTLLPKLMSGEIRISDAEVLVENV